MMGPAGPAWNVQEGSSGDQALGHRITGVAWRSQPNRIYMARPKRRAPQQKSAMMSEALTIAQGFAGIPQQLEELTGKP